MDDVKLFRGRTGPGCSSDVVDGIGSGGGHYCLLELLLRAVLYYPVQVVPPAVGEVCAISCCLSAAADVVGFFGRF